MSTWFRWLLELYVLTTSRAISGCELTCDNGYGEVMLFYSCPQCDSVVLSSWETRPPVPGMIFHSVTLSKH